MLEITILKVRHGGDTKLEARLEAQKVRPHIESCDVFSVEGSCATRDSAEHYELEQMDAQDKLDDIRDFFEVQSMIHTLNENPREAPTSRAWGDRIERYIFINKTPVYVSERWDDQKKASDLSEQHDSGEGLIDRAVDLLQAGHLQDSVNSFYEGLILDMGVIVQRDRHIAGNFLEAEQTIRDKYKKLKSKEVIRLKLVIGSNHRPELYTNLPVQVLSLVEESSLQVPSYRRAIELVRRDVPKDDVIPVLNAAAKEMLEYKNFRT